LIVGLAPAAHGGNRTGRVFTGDRSGDFLFASMFRCGFANQPTSVARDDGLVLHDAYITAAVRCAPPANKPTPAERDECAPYLERELELLEGVRVIVALGAFGYEAVWASLRHSLPADMLPVPRPRFAHGLEVDCGPITLIGAFHPSQQNTFTRRLTPEMLDDVFERAAYLSAKSSPIP
jgi:uracil-DNA glycosylase family 4